MSVRGGSREFTNMFSKLLEYYSRYQNEYVKHDNAIVEEEIEFILEITSSFMRHIVRMVTAHPGMVRGYLAEADGR